MLNFRWGPGAKRLDKFLRKWYTLACSTFPDTFDIDEHPPEHPTFTFAFFMKLNLLFSKKNIIQQKQIWRSLLIFSKCILVAAMKNLEQD